MTFSNTKVALITGSAKRLGAAMVAALHEAGFNIIIHYRHSQADAEKLAAQCNSQREHSAASLQADLNDAINYQSLIDRAIKIWGRLDVLVNNASSFYQTPIGDATEEQWNDLMASNVKAPFFLSQAAAPYLKQHQGCIVNLADIKGINPQPEYSIYCIAKAGLIMLTKSLAIELAPHVRVNAIAPGSILPPINNDPNLMKNSLDKILLQRQGSVTDICLTLLHLVNNANYTTGEIISVDGGKLLNGK